MRIKKLIHAKYLQRFLGQPATYFSLGFKNPLFMGRWLAQLQERAALDLGVLSLGPTLGMAIT